MRDTNVGARSPAKLTRLGPRQIVSWYDFGEALSIRNAFLKSHDYDNRSIENSVNSFVDATAIKALTAERSAVPVCY